MVPQTELADQPKDLASKSPTSPAASYDAPAEPASKVPLSKGAPRIGSSVPLFWFPQKVNENVARITSGIVVLICIVSIVFRAQQTIAFATGGLAADYFFRIVFGGKFSPIGVTASIIAAFVPRAYVDGAPKQFAAFCGFFFSFLAALMFFAVENTIAASCFLAALAGAAALECFINFCAGCFMFGMLVKAGLVSAEFKDEAHAALKDLEAADAWDDVKPGPEKPQRVLFPDDLPDSAAAVALRYKVNKTDEFQKEDHDIIRHVKVSWFVAPMGLVGFACVWIPAVNALHTPKGLWQGFGIASAIIFAALLVLYLARCIMYPRKIAKEWACPVRSNSFSAVTITLLLYAYMAAAGDRPRLCEVLFWIAAPLQLLLAVIMVARWIRSPFFVQSVSPGWMLPVLGNFVAAFVAPFVQGYVSRTLEFQEAGYLWFSFAFLMWLVLLTLTLNRIITSENLEERVRPSVFIYMAAPAMAGLAYLSLTLGIWDGFARMLFFMSWVWFFIMCWLGLTGYFWAKFQMSSWAYVFPLATLALISLEYHSHLRTAFTPVPAVASLVALSIVTYMCLGFSVLMLVEGELFLSDEKWGPLSFNMLVHKAIRGGLQRLEKQAADLVEAPSTVKLRQLKKTWDMMALLHEEHSLHEDKVLYPYFESFFPGVTARAQHEHEEFTQQLQEITTLLDSWGNSTGDQKAALVEQLRAKMTEHAVVLREHLLMEEDHLNPIPRKHMPVVMHIEALRKLYELTSPATWSQLLPFILEAQPLYGYRVRTLRCLRWAMPERMQQIGRFVYQGIDPYLWKRLIIDVPEMVPRGLDGCKVLGRPGWERYY